MAGIGLIGLASLCSPWPASLGTSLLRSVGQAGWLRALQNFSEKTGLSVCADLLEDRQRACLFWRSMRKEIRFVRFRGQSGQGLHNDALSAYARNGHRRGYFFFLPTNAPLFAFSPHAI